MRAASSAVNARPSAGATPITLNMSGVVATPFNCSGALPSPVKDTLAELYAASASNVLVCCCQSAKSR
jgi:hypothetical protein